MLILSSETIILLYWNQVTSKMAGNYLKDIFYHDCSVGHLMNLNVKQLLDWNQLCIILLVT